MRGKDRKTPFTLTPPLGGDRTAKAVLPRIDAMNRALSSLTRPCGPPSPAKTRERESRSACGRFMGRIIVRVHDANHRFH